MGFWYSLDIYEGVVALIEIELNWNWDFTEYEIGIWDFDNLKFEFGISGCPLAHP